MKKISIALLHVGVWLLSIPVFALLDAWLAREEKIHIGESELFLFLLGMSVWALVIFGKSFSYRPFTMGKALGFAAYLGVIWIAAIAGLVLAYVVVVVYRGGE
ncbi:hypothetical protein [Variovorax sp. OV329]|uniref:hypothetical protein n=1 Tax=Variovorax sp. OV329 TaxID=1882825 RepID=UPI0008E81F24|nr:hypothetical protein [Variovorax sp. OV329]SFM29393.1 hypothetical protein SAMN05444747_104132 [Variovorax sp. OV329]